MALLKLENINSGYGKRQVLYDVTFAIDSGGIALLIGANGSGKSTVLKTIYGLLHSTSQKLESQQYRSEGKIMFAGHDVSHLAPSKLLSLGLMYVPQREYCFDNLTVKENMEVSGRALVDRTEFSERSNQVFELLPSLAKIPKAVAGRLSGGERQILALAMVLLHRPKLLMLDEPLSGLSPKSIEEVSTTLQKLNKLSEITFLIVEQNVRDAIKIASWVIGLRMGRVVNNFDPRDGVESRTLHEIFL
jgi:ABC-type branched-subunit amino acid transport system ATPase component